MYARVPKRRMWEVRRSRRLRRSRSEGERPPIGPPSTGSPNAVRADCPSRARAPRTRSGRPEASCPTASSGTDHREDPANRWLRIGGGGNSTSSPSRCTPSNVVDGLSRSCRRAPLTSRSGKRHQGPILLRRDGQRLDRRTAHRWVRSIGKRAVLGDVHPHMLRAAFIIAALDAGVPSATYSSPLDTPIRTRPRSPTTAARTSTDTPPT